MAIVARTATATPACPSVPTEPQSQQPLSAPLCTRGTCLRPQCDAAFGRDQYAEPSLHTRNGTFNHVNRNVELGERARSLRANQRTRPTHTLPRFDRYPTLPTLPTQQHNHTDDGPLLPRDVPTPNSGVATCSPRPWRIATLLVGCWFSITRF